MTDKTEGTIVLDGLLEGNLPAAHDGADAMRAWIRSVHTMGLLFSLEVDGDRFSLLADPRAVSVDRLSTEPHERIAAVLDELLENFSPDERRGLLSTLRSMEYRPGVEVQTVYAIGADGAIDPRTRSVDAKTVKPPEPMSPRERVKLALMGLGVAAVLFGISAIFVDYGSLFDTVVDRIMPFDADSVAVETGSFGEYFTVDKQQAKRGGKVLILTLKRGKAFPVDDAALQKLQDAAGESVSARMTLDALARGYVRCECFDKKGKFLTFTMQRISALREKETVELILPLPVTPRPTRVVITY